MSNVSNGKIKIRTEMFLLSFLTLTIFTVIFSSIYLVSTYNQSMDSARSSLRECNRNIVTYTECMFHENGTIIKMLAENEDVINGSRENFGKIVNNFDSIRLQSTNITYLYAGYSDGSLYIGDYSKPTDYQATNRPWYTAALKTDGIASLAYSDAATGTWLLSQSLKLVDADGNTRGVVAIDCSNDSISRQLQTKYSYASQRSFLMSEDGLVLIHPNETMITASLHERLGDQSWAKLVNGTEKYFEYNINGKDSIAYAARVPGSAFWVVSSVNKDEIYYPIILSVIYLFASIVLFSIILSLLLSTVLIRRFATPVRELSERIKALATGQQYHAKHARFHNAEVSAIAENIEILLGDIAKREQERKSAEFLSLHDPMTGLCNRRYFVEKLHREITGGNLPLILISCDINGLKLANDLFGHSVGDRLILVIANTLLAGCPEDTVARIGGDEFSVLLPGCTNERAEQIIANIKLALPEAPFHGVHVSASFGYAVRTSREQSSEQLLTMADEMLYSKKLTESAVMRRRTIENIISAAEQEGLVKALTQNETNLLSGFANELCPDQIYTLLNSYRLRRVGTCSLILLGAGTTSGIRHSELSYRVLSNVEEYKSVASCILHYTENRDGSGFPAGLVGNDIPLLSRILAVAEAYATEGRLLFENEEMLSRLDPSLVKLIPKIMGTRE